MRGERRRLRRAVKRTLSMGVNAFLAGILVGCFLGETSETGVSAADEEMARSHEQEVLDWREERLASLQKPDGWLSLVGLDWLEEGSSTVGSAEGSAVRLPEAAPAELGTLELSESVVRFRPAPDADLTIDGEAPGGEPVEMVPDAAGEPTTVASGSVSFYVIERQGRFAARVKDSEAATRRDFAGIDYFPIEPAYRVEARFEPHEPPKTIPIPTVLGTDDPSESPGAVVFEMAGETYRIDALPGGDDGSLFLVFGDTTNGHTTYGGGRFLYTDPPAADGTVVVDFNRAYNPPCLFTPYATCPLPPPQNKLGVAVEAGEKAAGGH